jgi:hypothetical protein
VEQTETGKVELKFSGDSRILAGVCGAVNHLAEVSGMDEAGRAALVAAIEDACQQASDLLPNKEAPIEMSLAVVNGRIEATLVFPGVGGTAAPAEKIKRVLSGRIDRITQDVRGDSIKFTLVKNLTANGPKR